MEILTWFKWNWLKAFLVPCFILTRIASSESFHSGCAPLGNLPQCIFPFIWFRRFCLNCLSLLKSNFALEYFQTINLLHLFSPALQLSHSIKNTVQSSCFLASSAAAFQTLLCAKSALFPDSNWKYSYWLIGALAGLGVLIEKKPRRSELSLYVSGIEFLFFFTLFVCSCCRKPCKLFIRPWSIERWWSRFPKVTCYSFPAQWLCWWAITVTNRNPSHQLYPKYFQSFYKKYLCFMTCVNLLIKKEPVRNAEFDRQQWAEYFAEQSRVLRLKF